MVSIEHHIVNHAMVVGDTATNVRREYDFDAADRRVARRRLIAGALAASLSLITAPGLASDLESPHAEVDAASGVATTGYTYEGEHAHAAFDPSTTEPTYYLRDAMGSVIAVVNADASDSARIHYDGFGNERRSDGSLAVLPAEGAPRFQGMWREPDGLYYVRARNYDSQTGRFLSRDPAEGRRSQPWSWQTFGAFFANPYVWTDPTGRFNSPSLTVTSIASSILSSIALPAFTVRNVLLASAGAAAIAGVLGVDDLSPAELSLRDIQEALGLLTFNRTRNVRHACQQLGIDQQRCGRAIHSIKDAAGLRGDDDIEIDTLTGDVFDAETGEYIGNLTDED